MKETKIKSFIFIVSSVQISKNYLACFKKFTFVVRDIRLYYILYRLAVLVVVYIFV